MKVVEPGDCVFVYEGTLKYFEEYYKNKKIILLDKNGRIKNDSR